MLSVSTAWCQEVVALSPVSKLPSPDSYFFAFLFWPFLTSSFFPSGCNCLWYCQDHWRVQIGHGLICKKCSFKKMRAGWVRAINFWSAVPLPAPRFENCWVWIVQCRTSGSLAFFIAKQLKSNGCHHLRSSGFLRWSSVLRREKGTNEPQSHQHTLQCCFHHECLAPRCSKQGANTAHRYNFCTSTFPPNFFKTLRKCFSQPFLTCLLWCHNPHWLPETLLPDCWKPPCLTHTARTA